MKLEVWRSWKSWPSKKRSSRGAFPMPLLSFAVWRTCKPFYHLLLWFIWEHLVHLCITYTNKLSSADPASRKLISRLSTNFPDVLSCAGLISARCNNLSSVTLIYTCLLLLWSSQGRVKQSCTVRALPTMVSRSPTPRNTVRQVIAAFLYCRIIFPMLIIAKFFVVPILQY